MKEKIVFSWSGGKDSAMALHDILRSGNYDVSRSDDHRHESISTDPVCTGFAESLLEAQAEATGIPCDKIYMSYKPTNLEYESEAASERNFESYKAKEFIVIDSSETFFSEGLKAYLR